MAPSGEVPGPAPQFNGLPAPQGLTLSRIAGTGLAARWDAVPGATGYAIDRSEDGVAWEQAGVTGAETRALEDADLPMGGHRYFYRVSALDASGRSQPSTAASLVNRPAAPAGAALALFGKTFVVNWRDTSGEAGYRVERRTTHADGSVGAWEAIGAVGANVPSLSDMTVSPAEAYQYRVIATSPFGDSDPTETGGPLIPSSLTGLRVTVRLPTEVGLAWDAMDGATYALERSFDGRNFEPLATSTSAAYTDRGVAPAGRYYYRVTATLPAGANEASEVLAVTTPDGTAVPDGWEAADVGAPPEGFAGGVVNFGADGATLSFTGSGARILTSPTDSFSFVYRRMYNASIVARIVVWDFQPGTGLAGVMVRTSTAPGAACAFVGMRAQGGAFYQSRASGSASATGAAPTAATVEPAAGRPSVWVRLERRGSFVAGFVSSDGTAWGPLPNFDVSFEGPVLVGFAVTAGQRTGAYSATFDNVRVVEDFSPIVAAASAAFAFESPTQLSLWASATDGTAASGLSYTWSVVRAPPGIPTAAAARFSDNGTNAARHATATVFAAGHYVLRVEATNRQHLSGSAECAVDVCPIPTSIALSPPGVVVEAGGTRGFSAAAMDQFNRPVGGRSVNWSAASGSVSADGLYTAPLQSTWDIVTATLGNVRASVDVFSYNNADGPALLSAVSRKVHGRRGAVDLPLNLFGAAPTVEPRRGGPTTLVLTFSDDVSAYDGTLNDNDLGVTGATFRSASVSGRVLTVELADVEDGAVVGVDFSWMVNLLGWFVQGTTQVQVQSRFGDVDGSGAVNAADVLLLRRASALRAASTPSLLLDLDLSGSVSALDVVLARRRVATMYA